LSVQPRNKIFWVVVISATCLLCWLMSSQFLAAFQFMIVIVCWFTETEMAVAEDFDTRSLLDQTDIIEVGC